MSNIRVINRYAHTHVKTSDTRFDINHERMFKNDTVQIINKCTFSRTMRQGRQLRNRRIEYKILLILIA